MKDTCIYKTLLIFGMLTSVVGCTTTPTPSVNPTHSYPPPTVNPKHPDIPANPPQPRPANDLQTLMLRNSCLSLCYQEYQTVLTECESFLGHEIRLEVKDRQMITCLTNKNFPEAKDSCNDRCN